MNHGSQFQQLWSKLRSEVLALQQRGYYGDGAYATFRMFYCREVGSFLNTAAFSLYFSPIVFSPTFLIPDVGALGLDDPGTGFILQFQNSFHTASLNRMDFVGSPSLLTTRFFSPTAGLGYYKMGFGKQVIGLRVSDCWARVPLRDTRPSTTVLCRNTLFVLSPSLASTPRR